MTAKAERRQGWAPNLPDLLDWVGTVPGLRIPGGPHGIAVEERLSDDAYTVSAELPGIDPDEDVEITVEDELLTIRAERTEKTEDRQRSEFRYGQFTRAVRLPAGARTKEARATYDQGILTVTVPLAAAKETARTIKVERKEP
ncbi:Hsp20/alpha crystallin family protein [Actinacidiphila guanduensis]|jgi:HSP20 family molecular chaperone IbpA|uniref:Hsp20/alpha crystallin family protein n=1 Tax=Actinacidiphila guanduensis TaxID=310781 RepID=A0A1H0C6C3_9ACTN|nr:Hsp20/alpha crystallin family protein [Actinacidiphila guanduensis]SDN53402.1 Hsp20/alpha crystallin family protein [Actinacidiphila guanduensis]